MKWTSRHLALGGLALAVVLFVSVNVFTNATFRAAQLDLTEEGLYTLSDGTREVLATIDEPVTVRLFVSRRLTEISPGLGTYADRVRELLERYVSLSRGMITFEVIHPEPFSPEEDRAVGFNLQGIPLDQTGELGYMGLAGTNTTDDRDTIAFLSPQREPYLEYDLTRMVYNLAHPEKRVVGLLAGLPIEADPLKQNEPWRVIAQIQQLFEVKSLGFSAETISDDIDVLMVVHPIGLDDKTLYAIDQYVMKGGRAMIFVDPFAEEGSRSNQAMRMPPDSGSDLNTLFGAWGIEYDRSRALGDLAAAQRVSAGTDQTGRPIITDYLSWLTFRSDNFARDNVVTADLERINVASAGFIAKAADAEFAFEPLITSSARSGPFDAAKVRREPDPRAILREFKPGDTPLVLAARVTGTLPSAFPDGRPREEEKTENDAAAAEDGEPAEQSEAAEPAATPDPDHVARTDAANLIVVADSDILADRFWLQTQDFFGRQLEVPTANNADFVVNAIEYLSGTQGLQSLRARATSARPFTRVDEIRRAAEQEYRARERQLAERLQEVEKQLRDLQTREEAVGAEVLTEEQRQAIQDFRNEMVETRAELRNVQFALRRDIEALDSRLKIINIAAMPAAVLLFAIGLWLYRRARARQRLGASG